MANSTAIERPQTESERKDFKLLGEPTIFDEFNKKLAEAQQKFAKKFKPFDMPCARLDFRDRVENAEKESIRRSGFVKKDMEVKIGNFEEYAKEDRFVLVNDDEDRQDKVMEGMRTQVVTGHTLQYRCKNRGHGISIFIPMREYVRRYPENFTDHELKEIYKFSEAEIEKLRKKK